MEQRYWQAWTLSAKTTIITEVWRGVTRTLQGKALTRCFVGRFLPKMEGSIRRRSQDESRSERAEWFLEGVDEVEGLD